MDLGIIGKALAGAGKGLGQANLLAMRAEIMQRRDEVLNGFRTQAQERGIQAQSALQSQKLGSEQAMQAKQFGTEQSIAGQRNAAQLKLGAMQLGPEEQKAQAFMLGAETAAQKGELQIAQLRMLQGAWGNVVNAKTPAERQTALANFNELRGTPQFRGFNLGFNPVSGTKEVGGFNIYTGSSVTPGGNSTTPGAGISPQIPIPGMPAGAGTTAPPSSGTNWQSFNIPGNPPQVPAQGNAAAQAAAASTGNGG